ncbi:MAG: YqgE/AlgH family protein [Leptospiraceae bacterium]|nr:YqgE/AlgH family protein [Leptospiraceae bacterium]
MGDFHRSLKGKFIIAGSALRDPNFYQSIVLLIEHQREGAFGLIVNRIANLTLGQVVPEIENETSEQVVFEGGPVRQDILFILHKHEQYQEEDSELIPGVFVGRSKEVLLKLAEKSMGFRVFRGYAGWGPGQLEDEIRANSWLSLDAVPEEIFTAEPELAWRDSLLTLGGICNYYSRMVRDPALN